MRPSRLALFLLALAAAACARDEFSESGDRLFAPSIDRRGTPVDGLLVGHRLMDAGEHELALEAFQRAAFDRGLDGEVLSAIGSANLALGRLNQAEDLLRRAVKTEAASPAVWNNLGVVLVERGKTAEASEIFRKAYALDNGRSDAIRDNLRLTLAKLDNTGYDAAEAEDYRLVRRGTGDYLIQTGG
ncbi:tetratricopeptide repeat protein [Roseivivax isoporae]|uniref:Uncharacterized protein n=1 Tax=Roseivivax isoporae LMG 25204 TaxID=1449351 RepID=X7FDS5_9RHOB|nr:tetratricopeptide repeat protein [Roseivivax isoporae]ETX30955.1 hypothetical protein RISW2_00825 [Roseivivax isoporae LMG 25204]